MCALKRLVSLPILVLSACSHVQPGDFPPFARPEAPPAVQAPAAETPVHVYEDGKTSILLMPGPCKDASSLMMIEAAGPEYAARARAITSTWQYRDGSLKPHAGCWIELSKEEVGSPEEMLFLIFDDGERAVVPKAEFLKKKGGGA